MAKGKSLDDKKIVLINPTQLTPEQKEILDKLLEDIEYDETVAVHSAATDGDDE